MAAASSQMRGMQLNPAHMAWMLNDNALSEMSRYQMAVMNGSSNDNNINTLVHNVNGIGNITPNMSNIANISQINDNNRLRAQLQHLQAQQAQHAQQAQQAHAQAQAQVQQLQQMEQEAQHEIQQRHVRKKSKKQSLDGPPGKKKARRINYSVSRWNKRVDGYCHWDKHSSQSSSYNNNPNDASMNNAIDSHNINRVFDVIGFDKHAQSQSHNLNINDTNCNYFNKKLSQRELQIAKRKALNEQNEAMRKGKSRFDCDRIYKETFDQCCKHFMLSKVKNFRVSQLKNKNSNKGKDPGGGGGGIGSGGGVGGGNGSASSGGGGGSSGGVNNGIIGNNATVGGGNRGSFNPRENIIRVNVNLPNKNSNNNNSNSNNNRQYRNYNNDNNNNNSNNNQSGNNNNNHSHNHNRRGNKNRNSGHNNHRKNNLNINTSKNNHIVVHSAVNERITKSVENVNNVTNSMIGAWTVKGGLNTDIDERLRVELEKYRDVHEENRNISWEMDDLSPGVNRQAKWNDIVQVDSNNDNNKNKLNLSNGMSRIGQRRNLKANANIGDNGENYTDRIMFDRFDTFDGNKNMIQTTNAPRTLLYGYMKQILNETNMMNYNSTNSNKNNAMDNDFFLNRLITGLQYCGICSIADLLIATDEDVCCSSFFRFFCFFFFFWCIVLVA